MAKSWEEKFYTDRPPEVKRVHKKFADIPMGSDVLIASPQVVADYLNQVPEGYSTDVKKMRVDLANEYGAEYTCPVTTGIFLRIVAEYGYEQLQQGKQESEVPPFWRAIDRKSKAIQKLSFGKDFVIKKRLEEGLET